MSAPAIQTAEKFREKYAPLRVENGRVADGEFAGATVSTESRWDCVSAAEAWRGQPCFWVDGWLVHNPRCQFDHEQPVKPLPLPGPYEARQIEYQELVKAGHFDPFDGCRDGELARRQENARRGGDGR